MSDEIKAKIAEIEAEMDRTQKNKATNYHLGTLKARKELERVCLVCLKFAHSYEMNDFTN